jgi:hypothetical protein
LTDDVLLRICRVREGQVCASPEWLENLRMVPQLAAQSAPGITARLEQALTLLAWALGQLPQYQPTHLPCGYAGPVLHSAGWIERETLAQVGKQIVGLIWDDCKPETVATAVQRAISVAVRLGFLMRKEYDAWRPGMPSGAGWRSAVSATEYGVAKVRGTSAAESDRGDDPPIMPNRNESATAQSVTAQPVTAQSVTADSVTPVSACARLTDTERNILEALGADRLTGEQLAKRAGYPFNSNFKGTLSSLRKRGVLGNAAPGYFVIDAHRPRSVRGQDNVQDRGQNNGQD